MTPRTVAAVLIGAVLAVAPSLAAARQEDDATRDYEEQDRRYSERYAKPAPERPPAPPPDPQAAREAFIARAEALIRDPHYRSASAGRYRVQTDDPRVDAGAAAGLLDSFRAFFDAFWSGRLELGPYEAESRSFLFYSFYKFNELLVEDQRFRAARPKGHYRPALDVITIHTDPGAGASLAETLLHEAAHQLVEQRILDGSAPAAPWLSEGLASYFGYTLVDRDGKFQPGAIGGKGVVLLRGGERDSGGEPRARLDTLKRSAKSAAEGSTPIADVLAIRDPEEFYGESSAWNYSASWILVHFLLHGDGGAHATAFARWLESAAAEPDAEDRLLEALSLTAAQLDAAALAHARGLKSREP